MLSLLINSFNLNRESLKKKARLETASGMSPTTSASNEVPASVQEQVANVLEELQMLGSLDRLIAASEVSHLAEPSIVTLCWTLYVRHQL